MTGAQTIDALHATTDMVVRHLHSYAAICAECPKVTAEEALTSAADDIRDAMLTLIARYEQTLPRQTA